MVAELTRRQHARIASRAGISAAEVSAVATEVARAGSTTTIGLSPRRAAAGSRGCWPAAPADRQHDHRRVGDDPAGSLRAVRCSMGACGSLRAASGPPRRLVVLLAGCGVAGTQFHPGVAAEVGDQTITTRHVDQVTDDYCKAIEKVSEGQERRAGQPTPMRYLTHEFASALIDAGRPPSSSPTSTT